MCYLQDGYIAAEKSDQEPSEQETIQVQDHCLKIHLVV